MAKVEENKEKKEKHLRKFAWCIKAYSNAKSAIDSLYYHINKKSRIAAIADGGEIVNAVHDLFEGGYIDADVKKTVGKLADEVGISAAKGKWKKVSSGWKKLKDLIAKETKDGSLVRS